MELLTPSEVRRLLLATIAGRDPATKGEAVALIEWAMEVRAAGQTLSRLLDGSLIVVRMGADGPEVARVADWPEEKQQLYREALAKSDSSGER